MHSTVARSLSGSIRLWRDLPWWGWAVAAALIFPLSMVGVATRTPGMSVAAWWPAAGVSLLFALLVPHRNWAWAIVFVAVVTGTANYVSGRGWLLSTIYGLANSLEIAIALNIIRWRRGTFVLSSLSAAARFVLGCTIGAVFLGCAVGIASAVVNGSDFMTTLLLASASHLSATVLIAPFAALPARSPADGRWPEVALQSAFVALALLLAFGPGTVLPVSFLLFGFLTWAGLRFAMPVALVQTLLVAILALLLTVAGAGSLVSDAYTQTETALTLVAFLCTVSIFMVLLTTARYEGTKNAMVALSAARAQAEAQRAQATALTATLELERQRETFVATTSHELRTPITNIVGYTELLRAEALEEPRQGWVEVIQRNAERLSVLVEDLLSLDHDETGAPAAAAPQLAVAALLADCARPFRAVAASHSLEITVETDAALQLQADRTTVLRILTALVSNAIKFTPAGGSVVLSASADADVVVIGVRDTGIGMTEQTIEGAFQRFFRGPDAETMGVAGVGLGLSIARELAIRIGGTLTIRSERGRGTTASLRLPAGAAGDG